MDSASGSIHFDSSGGTSHGSGNPPDGLPYGLLFDEELLSGLARMGFIDAMTGEADFLLSHASYEHIRAYLELIRRKPRRGEQRMQDAHLLMLFDRELKSIIFEYIGVFETKLRVQYSHAMSSLHGSFCVYDPTLFLNRRNYDRSLANYEREVGIQVRQGSGVYRKAVTESEGKCPVQLGVECITLGTLSKLYANTADNAATLTVARSFGATKGILSNWLKTICCARNAIAHFDPLIVKKELQMKPKPIRGFDARNTAPFYVVFLLLRLISTDFAAEDRLLGYHALLAKKIDESLTRWEPLFGYLYPVLGIPADWRQAMEAAAGLNLPFQDGEREGAS